ncbi:hypothetical protein LX36DRAFT_663654 [Colletotrichum falcatum]|nr:hypothetical protein LX36DRAFT_663654 [Colletotrichum falcatum]
MPFAHPPLRSNDSVFAIATFSSSAHADPPFPDPSPTCLVSLRLSPVELPVFVFLVFCPLSPMPPATNATSRIRLLPSHFRFHLGPVP